MAPRKRKRTYVKQSKMKKTRKVEENLLGIEKPTDLNMSLLPTYSDILRCFLYEKGMFEHNNVSPYKVAYAVAIKVDKIWKDASIPIVRFDSITRRIENLYNKCRYQSVVQKKLIEEFTCELRTLFDIVCCKCPKESSNFRDRIFTRPAH